MLRPPRARRPLLVESQERCPDCAGDLRAARYPREVAGRRVTMLDLRCGACPWAYTRVESLPAG